MSPSMLVCAWGLASALPSGSSAAPRKLAPWNEAFLLSEFGNLPMQGFLESKVSSVMRLMDENCDNLLSSGEISASLPRLLGKDPELGTSVSCMTYAGPLDPVLRMNVEVLHSVGRVDYKVCGLRYSMNYLSLPDTSNGISLHTLCQHILGFIVAFCLIEEDWFVREYDVNQDGCLSQLEWDGYREKYGMRNCNVCNISAITNAEIDEEWLPVTESFSQLGLALNYSSSCTDKYRFLLFNVMSLLNVFTNINETATCGAVRDSSDEGERGATVALAVILAASLTLCGIVTVLFCIRALWYQRKWRQSHQRTQLLKAKIDAWTDFTQDLTAKASDLEPAFCHCLGLHTDGMESLSLFYVVHAEDEERLRSALDQVLDVGHEAGMSGMPVLTRVRMQYGARAEDIRGDAVVKLYEDAAKQYVVMEVLMMWSSKSSILVGLTSLSEVGPPATSLGVDSGILSHHQHDEELFSASQSVCKHSIAGVILNSSEEVVSDTASQARTFRSAEVDSHLGGQVTAYYSDFKQAAFDRTVMASVASLAEREREMSESNGSSRTSI
eukprot:TRINITY_DN10399_c0_g1_i6.p1 TRINITY_DN10399_c0_g1~~TRINITY_DN10399_c0_g1_i6.p1  ORF type:complete len:555 (+),score=59.39 TRINITY_DN10399_c0_g1_i6:47-1711(+)